MHISNDNPFEAEEPALLRAEGTQTHPITIARHGSFHQDCYQGRSGTHHQTMNIRASCRANSTAWSVSTALGIMQAGQITEPLRDSIKGDSRFSTSLRPLAQDFK
jgi:hypothetical protein